MKETTNLQSLGISKSEITRNSSTVNFPFNPIVQHVIIIGGGTQVEAAIKESASLDQGTNERKKEGKNGKKGREGFT